MPDTEPANSANQPTADQLTPNQPTPNQPTADQPTSNGPAANGPAANEPAANEPATNEPTPNQLTIDDEAELSPQEMLELLHTQQRRTAADLAGPTALIVFIWGVAWFVGFLAIWSARVEDSPVQIPLWAAGTLFGVLMFVALVASAILGIRSSRGVRTADSRQGMLYGISWTIGMIAVWVLGMALIQQDASYELSALYFPAGYSLMVGMLYLSGGALWRVTGMYVMGVWLVVIGVVAPFFGAPTNSLIMAVFGGGGFLLFALVLAIYSARLRRSIGRSSTGRSSTSRSSAGRSHE